MKKHAVIFLCALFGFGLCFRERESREAQAKEIARG